MKAKLVVLGFVATLSTETFAGELTLGEMDTAATLENNDFLLNLGNPSQIGLTDRLALGSWLVFLPGFANLGLE